MYNELNNTRGACDQLSREKVKYSKRINVFFDATTTYTTKHMILMSEPVPVPAPDK